MERLLLSASRYPGIDMPHAVEQIAARRHIREKLPSWYANPRLVFPSKIAAEQCSSECTAAYKQQLVEETEHVCDLTGGLGIDSYYLSRKAGQLTYVERSPAYCKAARHNFTCLRANNIEVKEGKAEEILPALPRVDVFYIDPARRGEGNRRVFALNECEPDLAKLLPELWKYAPKVIAKLSPMADISRTLELLPAATGIHVLAVRNDCKELLFVLEREAAAASPAVYCTNFTTGSAESFAFNRQEERDMQIAFAPQVQAYLYEPNVSIMKAGAFKSITRLGVNKLHLNSHCYTSDALVENFPGRVFQVDGVIPFSSKSCKSLAKAIPQANITARNFPLTAGELRKRTQIADGGDVYLFATTLSDGEKILAVCRKALSLPKKVES
ncbi:hypothetical protein FACS1894181_01270 [Bacteroidia bacterium]|nr:hypothetical protein FACS1894181_01270 [Bacteroidia bacterium]